MLGERVPILQLAPGSGDEVRHRQRFSRFGAKSLERGPVIWGFWGRIEGSLNGRGPFACQATGFGFYDSLPSSPGQLASPLAKNGP